MSSGYYRRGQRKVSPSSDCRTWGVCDRCEQLNELQNLRWQFQENAQELYNQRILVCFECWDKPQPQLKQYIIPPDPLGIPNARPEFFTSAEVNFLVTQDHVIIETQDETPIVTNTPSQNFPDPPSEE
jgi:hypothetical protein